MELIQLLRILNARKALALRVFAAVLALGLAGILLLPKKYTGVAAVISDPKAPDPVYGYSVPIIAGNESNTGTQIDIITSDRVALRAVRSLGLDKDPEAIEAWKTDGEGKGSVEQYVAEVLFKHLDVSPSPVKPPLESDVIYIEYTDPDPKFAADVANAFAKAYVAVSLEMRSNPAKTTSEFFDARTQQLRDEVEKAQARLTEFQRTHGVSATDEHLDVENARLTDLGAQLTAVQALRAESQSRQAEAQASVSNSPDVMQSPVIQQLRTDISHSESKLENLHKLYGSNHPQILAAQAELDSLNAKLQTEMRQVASTVRTTNSVNLGREAQIRAELQEQQRKVVALRAERDQAMVLQKDLEEAQKAYDLVAQRRSQTNLESLNQQSHAAIVSEALPPLEFSRPKVKLLFPLSAAFALFLGLGSAIVAELRDRRVRGAEDCQQVFGLPILATLPVVRRQGTPEDAPAGWRARLRLGRKPSAEVA